MQVTKKILTFKLKSVIIAEKRDDKMIARFSNFITDFFIKNLVISKNEKEIFSYGLECIIGVVINILVVILSGILMNTVKESIIFFVVFFILRIYCGGYHAATNLKCNCVLFLNLIAVLILIKNINESMAALVISDIICIIVSFAISPVENHNKKIKCRRKYKFISTALIVVFSILCIFIYQYRIYISSLISYAMLSVVVAMAYGKRKEGKV